MLAASCRVFGSSRSCEDAEQPETAGVTDGPQAGAGKAIAIKTHIWVILRNFGLKVGAVSAARAVSRLIESIRVFKSVSN